jgi:hypothetical protein
MAIERGVSVQDVDAAALTARLKSQRAVFEDSTPATAAPARELVIK